MFAYATLVTNADYALGARALARSLKQANAQAPLVVMTTAPDLDLTDLEREGCLVRAVAHVPVSEGFRERHSRKAVHERAPFTKGEKPAFHDPLDNFCKLRLWEMTEYERIVFVDADAIVVRNTDKLVGYPEFSGAPNLYETLDDMHRLNSGVFVARPDEAQFERMVEVLDAPGATWRRTDQTFLETYFPDWHGLPYTYNTLQYVYFNLPQLWHWPSIRVVHYQYEKPWATDHPRRAQLTPLIDLWHGVLEGKPLPEALPAAARS